MVGENVTAEGLAGDARAARDGDINGGKVAFKVLRALGVVLLTTTMTACANDKNYFSIGGVIEILAWGLGALFWVVAIWELCRKSDDKADANPKSKTEWTPLHIAAWHGRTETALALVKKGLDIDIKQNGGWAPLHVATLSGQTETALALINSGADLSAHTDSGNIPLDIAIKEHGKDSKIARILREAMEKRGGK